MTATSSWKDTPDYDALVETTGQPAQLIHLLDQLLAQARDAWNQVFTQQLDTHFPVPVNIEEFLARYPDPSWPTVQDVWDELWPPPEPVIDMGYLSLPWEYQDLSVGRIVPTEPPWDSPVVDVELPAVSAEDTQQFAAVAPADVEVQQLALESP